MRRFLALAAATLMAIGCAPTSASRGATLATAVAATPVAATAMAAHDSATHAPAAAAPTPVLATAAAPTPAVAIAAPTPSAPMSLARPTPTLVNVDDMMGYFPQQTVFVATPERVSAVTLLNHFSRYRVATNGLAQVAASPSGSMLFVLDADAASGHRLRTVDVASGGERAVQHGLANVVHGGRALSAEQPGRVLVLNADAAHAWVEAYDAASLRPLGTVAEGPACSDHLLAGVTRVVLICRGEGSIVVDGVRVEGPGSAIVAAALGSDGVVYLATVEQPFLALAPGSTHVAKVTWPSEWSGAVIADSLSVAGNVAVVAQRSGDSAFVRVFDPGSMGQRKSWRLAGVPNGGVLAMWPFAYYTLGATVRHVDLTSGLLETMTEVGEGAMPGAVVNG